MIKKAAALVNAELGRLDRERAAAIVRACEEIIAGKIRRSVHRRRFPDGGRHILPHECQRSDRQPGRRMSGECKGEYTLVHPNDHVNLGQSTNDVYPTAMRLAAGYARNHLLPNSQARTRLPGEGEGIRTRRQVRAGPTSRMPRRSGWAGNSGPTRPQCRSAAGRFLARAARSLLELGIGGSAVGHGLNTAPGYG